MRQHFILFLLILGLLSCGSATDTESTASSQESDLKDEQISEDGVQFVDSREAEILIREQGSLIVLDVRTQDEYDKGHIQNALMIDFNSPDFSKHLQALDPDKTYLVYCAVGGRSSKAAVLMGKTGFKKVYGVSEGYSELKEAGVPVSEP